MFSTRLTPYGVVRRVENPIDPGFPDFVCCFRGHVHLIEAKYLPRLPARVATPIHIDSLTLEQVTWAESWAKAGGSAWLLLQAGRSCYGLFAPAVMRALFEGRVDYVALTKRAAWMDTRLTPLILKVLR